ncbi:MAG: zinc-dependent metalloprotease [Bacteroidota bacterium]
MKYLIVFLFLLHLLTPATAQEDESRTYRQMRTLEAMQLLQEKNPQVRLNQAAIERFIAKESSRVKSQEISIPLAIHILYTNNSEKISEEQILSQIEALNRDFSYAERDKGRLQIDHKKGFSEKATPIDIQFCLAGSARYIRSKKSGWTYDNTIKSSEHGGIEAFDPENVVNIWVAALDEQLSGYAQMPGGPSTTDGIVIDYRFFGTMGSVQAPYDEGKTLTHLMGNFLGLYPLWGLTECSDDYVMDTPIHNYPNYGCPDDNHISTCAGFPVEMIVNFMDNTDDACLYLFTYGQKKRMQAILSEGGPRASLATSRRACKEQKAEERELSETNAESLDIPGFDLFPNPANRETFVDLYLPEATPQVSLQVFDLTGRIVYDRPIDGTAKQQQIRIDCSEWSPGIYFFQMSIEGERLNKRLLINRP